MPWIERGANVSGQYTPTNFAEPTGAAKRISLSKDDRSGALVGGIVGFLHGILNAVYEWAISPIIMAELTRNQPSLAASYSAFLITSYVTSPLLGILFGAVLGILFVKFKHRIPGRSIIRKSVIVSLAFVVFAALGNVISIFSGALQYSSLTVFRFLFPMSRT